MLGASQTPRRSSPQFSKELDQIVAARRGDISAFNQLVRAYQELAFRFTFYILDDANAAERITQRAFEVAFRRIREMRGDRFKVWLLRIALQECKGATHGRMYGQRVSAHTPIEMALAVLAPDERALCVLTDVLGSPDDEVAEIMNLSVAAIRAIRSRTRRQVRDVLQIHSMAAGTPAMTVSGRTVN